MILALVLFALLGFLIGCVFRLRELVASLIVAAIVVTAAMIMRQSDLLVVVGAAVGAVVAMQAGFFVGLLFTAARRAAARRDAWRADKAKDPAAESQIHGRLGDGPG